MIIRCVNIYGCDNQPATHYYYSQYHSRPDNLIAVCEGCNIWFDDDGDYDRIEEEKYLNYQIFK